MREGKTIPEWPAVKASQSNGGVEEAGKRVREYVGVCMDQIEHEGGGALEAGQATNAVVGEVGCNDYGPVQNRSRWPNSIRTTEMQTLQRQVRAIWIPSNVPCQWKTQRWGDE